MPSLEINNILVDFPVEPYEVQRTYMEHVIKCIGKKGNIGLLESPSGTGKTYSLLCSTLAWVKTQTNDEMSVSSDFKDEGQAHPYHIIYASRTHSQLKRAIDHFKDTSYRNMSSTVLGSREQMCVFPSVSKLENSAKMKRACEFHISDKAIIFNKDTNSHEDMRCKHQRTSLDLSDLFDGPMDIEDLVSKCKKKSVCPYFASRSAALNNVITFCPYDYVLEEAYKLYTEGNHKNYEERLLNLQNSIIIFDEGHNLQSKFEDFASAKIDTQEIKYCIKAVQKLINKEPSLLSLRFHWIIESLKDLVKRIDSYTVKPSSERVGVLEADLPPGEISNLLRLFGDISNDGFDLCHPDKESLEMVASINNIAKFFTKASLFHSHSERFCQIHLEEMSLKESHSECRKVRTLEFWCVDPSITMNQIIESGVHSILITSATLEPMSVLKADLGIRDAIVLRNTHVIQNYQVLARIVMCGPDGVYFNSSYRTRFDEDYLHSLGLAVLKVSSAVKHKGVIVVLPSYEMLQCCKENWLRKNPEGRSVWKELLKIKEVYEEPRKNEDFKKMMSNFRKCIQEKRSEGAVLFSVFRGKVAEGVDFEDDHGRIVIVVGIPYRPRSDPKLKLKFEYLREKKIIEEQWYLEDALRTANQAMGRVIRHAKDYGAVFLFDYRFKPQYLPGWLATLVQYERRFCDLIIQTEEFFSDVQDRVNAHSNAQQHSGNFRRWEWRKSEAEWQSLLIKNEGLSNRKVYLSRTIQELKEELQNLKLQRDSLKEEYQFIVNEFNNEDMVLGEGEDAEVLPAVIETVEPQRSGAVPRKRLHAPDPGL